MARSTWDGSNDPEVHAEPLDAQIPLPSSRIRSDSPSTNRKLTFTLFGSLSVLCPFSRQYGISSRIRLIIWSRSPLSFSALASIVAAARRTAVPSPMIPGTFSVPARRFRSWAPPCTKERIFTPLRIYKKPIPFGPFSLCPLALSISIWHSSTWIGTWPNAWTASVWNRIPFSWAILPISRIG